MNAFGTTIKLLDDEDTSTWAGDTLSYLAHYDWPEKHSTLHELKRVEMTAPDCGYWVAIGGQVIGLRDVHNTMCLASVTTALRLAANLSRAGDGIYVIWKPKTVTPAILKRWVAKWSKRTAPRMFNVTEQIRKAMLRPTKRVEYSYPTSPNASYFHKPDGCYTVELVEHEPEIQPGVAIAAFDSLDAAHAFAETLSEPWDRLTK